MILLEELIIRSKNFTRRNSLSFFSLEIYLEYSVELSKTMRKSNLACAVSRKNSLQQDREGKYPSLILDELVASEGGSSLVRLGI